MGYLLKDYTIEWTDDGPIVHFKSPFKLNEVALPGPVVRMDFGTTRPQIIQYFKQFEYCMEVVTDNEPITTEVMLAPPDDREQLVVDKETGDILIDEFGMKVYTVAVFKKLDAHLLIDLRYD